MTPGRGHGDDCERLEARGMDAGGVFEGAQKKGRSVLSARAAMLGVSLGLVGVEGVPMLYRLPVLGNVCTPSKKGSVHLWIMVHLSDSSLVL